MQNAELLEFFADFLEPIKEGGLALGGCFGNVIPMCRAGNLVATECELLNGGKITLGHVGISTYVNRFARKSCLCEHIFELVAGER